MGNWYDPRTWWHAVEGVAGGIADDVKNFVQNAVQTVADLLDQGLTYLDDFGHWVYDRAMEIGHAAWDFAGHAWDFADRIVTHDLPSFFHWAVDEAHRVGDWVLQTARGWFDWAVHEAHAVGDWAVQTARGWFDWAVHEAHALADWLVGVIGRTGHDILEWVWREIWSPLKQGLSDLLDWVFEPIHFVTHELHDMWHLVMSVADWLIWLSKLPFKGVHAFEELLAERLTYANVRRGGGEVVGHAHDIERAIAHFLGD